MMKKIIQLIALCLVMATAISLQVAYAAEKEYPYYITVNLTQNIVTVYEEDNTGEKEPIKAFYCSVGNGTPTGAFQTTQKYEWRPLFGDVYGQYATRITGHILFHSVPYFEMDKSTLEYEEYNKLGETASMGCIRLTAEDAKWIYDNCSSGTTVELYKSREAEPIAPALPQKIDLTDARKGWDPTDPDLDNPWNMQYGKYSFQSETRAFEMDAYYIEDSYYISAKDVKTMFAFLGKIVILPYNENEPTVNQTQSLVSVRYQTKLNQVHYRMYDETMIYRVEDLAQMVGVGSESQQGGNGITLSRIWNDKLERVSLRLSNGK